MVSPVASAVVQYSMPDLAGWLERLCATQETVKCYLCLERVPEKQWTSGRHRVQVLQLFTSVDLVRLPAVRAA